MTSLIVLRGLPGSGKTTYARYLQGRMRTLIRLSRDDRRRELFGMPDHQLWQERVVTSLLGMESLELLASGVSVMVDATNARREHLAAWGLIATQADVPMKILDFGDSAEVCVDRQADRPEAERVPAEIIVRMARDLAACRESVPPVRWVVRTDPGSRSPFRVEYADGALVEL